MPAAVLCPCCGKVLQTRDEQAGQIARCPACGGCFRVPAKSNATTLDRDAQPQHAVHYLHHTRDNDGDVILYFREPGRPDGPPLVSSPVVAIRRLPGPPGGHVSGAARWRYLLCTRNSRYEVELPRDKADHIAKEVGGFLE